MKLLSKLIPKLNNKGKTQLCLGCTKIHFTVEYSHTNYKGIDPNPNKYNDHKLQMMIRYTQVSQ